MTAAERPRCGKHGMEDRARDRSARAAAAVTTVEGFPLHVRRASPDYLDAPGDVACSRRDDRGTSLSHTRHAIRPPGLHCVVERSAPAAHAGRRRRAVRAADRRQPRRAGAPDRADDGDDGERERNYRPLAGWRTPMRGMRERRRARSVRRVRDGRTVRRDEFVRGSISALVRTEIGGASWSVDRACAGAVDPASRTGGRAGTPASARLGLDRSGAPRRRCGGSSDAMRGLSRDGPRLREAHTHG